MRSPDDVVLDAIDVALAVPQRRGVPLPAAVAPLRFVAPAGFAVAAAGGALGSFRHLAALWLLFAAVQALTALREGRRLMADAESWSPSLAARYRAEALRLRHAHLWFRVCGILVYVFMLTLLAVSLAAHGGLPQPAVSLGFLVAVSGLVLGLYVECAMPQDPDLRVATPEPA